METSQRRAHLLMLLVSVCRGMLAVVGAFSPVPSSIGCQLGEARDADRRWRPRDASPSSLLSSGATTSTSFSVADEGEERGQQYSSSLPSLEMLKSDPFMKQVEYGSVLTAELKSSSSSAASNSRYLCDALNMQLSHSDGIRGFMVSYLTCHDDEEKTGADVEFFEPEAILVSTIIDRLRSFADRTSGDVNESNDDLVGLMCMNVVMPTAMITMHTDVELSKSSARTAQRGMGILRSILLHERNGDDVDWGVELNLHAILLATAVKNDSFGGNSGVSSADDRLVTYWEKFFHNYGYGKQQVQGIANAAKQILMK